MNSIIRSTIAAGTMYAGMLNPEMAFAEDTTTTTSTTETTLPGTTTTTTTEMTVPDTTTTTLSELELMDRDCGEDDIDDIVNIPTEDPELYLRVNEETGTFCGVMSPPQEVFAEPAPIDRPKQPRPELPRTGRDNLYLGLGGLALITAGSVLNKAGKSLYTRLNSNL